jgi:hypothetical protein
MGQCNQAFTPKTYRVSARLSIQNILIIARIILKCSGGGEMGFCLAVLKYYIPGALKNMRCPER